MFIIALLITAKTWKQPRCPLRDEWIKKMWYIYIVEYYSAIKKVWNNAISSNMDGPGDYHIKWSKSDRERQIPYDITYMWNLKCDTGTSLVAQWLRICLPIQGTQVQSLVREDPTCHGATKPVCRNYWACALEPASHNYWACVLQLLKPACLEPVLCNKRSHWNEKPTHRKEE